MSRFDASLVAGALAVACSAASLAADAPPPARTAAPKSAAVAAATSADLVRRGRYLVETGGCGDCHTPMKTGKHGPEPDTARLLSGHPHDVAMPPAPKLPAGPWLVVVSASNTAWAGPWGVSFTANLTPDVETGLGQWNARQFVETMRSGRHLGVGRAILPPMPIPAYKNFDDADLQAIFAYLQSIPAVSNRVPAPRPPPGAAPGAK